MLPFILVEDVIWVSFIHFSLHLGYEIDASIFDDLPVFFLRSSSLPETRRCCPAVQIIFFWYFSHVGLEKCPRGDITVLHWGMHETHLKKM